MRAPAIAAPLAPVVPRVAGDLDIPRHRIGDASAVCVSFDDGPHPEGTPAVLEALAGAGATAAFFLVGEQVRAAPSLAAEIAAAGHEVCLHGERHRCQLRLTARAIEDDLRRGADTVGGATGVAPRVYRPPYGIFTASGLRAARAQGLELLLWSRWGHDWRRSATAESIAAEVSRDLSAGDVLLLHDSDAYSSRGSWRATAAAVPRVLEAIAARGLVGRARGAGASNGGWAL